MSNHLPDPARFDEGPRHHRGAVDTERTAAHLVRPRAGQLRDLALTAFVDAGPTGLTDHELAERTGKYLYTIAPRRTELFHQGWLVDSGERRTTPNGRTAVVWRLSEVGAAEIARTPA